MTDTKGKKKMEDREESLRRQEKEPVSTMKERESEMDQDQSGEGVVLELQAQVQEYRDLLQRKQAEFENFRRRVVQEKLEARRSGRAEVLAEILLVLDACSRGLETLEEEEDSPAVEGFRQGYELLIKQLQSILTRFGIEEVPGEGAPFDPNLHEAVLHEPSEEYEEGSIIEEYRKGYVLGDRLLRPSQVKVAAAPDKSSEEA